MQKPHQSFPGKRNCAECNQSQARENKGCFLNIREKPASLRNKKHNGNNDNQIYLYITFLVKTVFTRKSLKCKGVHK